MKAFAHLAPDIGHIHRALLQGMGKQDAALFKGFAQGGYKEATGFVQVEFGLGQLLVQRIGSLVQVHCRIDFQVRRVQLATRKHIGAAQHRRIAVATQHEHLQAFVGMVAQNQDGGGIACRRGDNLGIEFHEFIVACRPQGPRTPG